MGNIAYLRGLSSLDGRVGDGNVVRESKNSIPVLWFSLFESSGAHTFSLDLEGGQVLGVPGFVLPVSRARHLWEQRSVQFRAWLPSTLHSHLGAWQAIIDSLATPFIGLDPAELGLLIEPADLSRWLNDAVQAFSDPSSEHLLALFDVPGLAFDTESRRVTEFEPRVIAYSLTGYE